MTANAARHASAKSARPERRAVYRALGVDDPPNRLRYAVRRSRFAKVSMMHNYSGVLAVVGSLCLTITLVLAWCLVGVRSSAFMKKVFPGYQQLLKAHMDYLLMTGLLMMFYLLFANLRVSVSPAIL